ncbi:ABC transporter ATP-binding protein [Pararhizobium mangrovi]|uniref:ABC transporter ATP-binding protein n=1 Tax=Pararhizobium mangrovi TaxID=2590452 RepID=A0A506U9S1_9HYPH|nr:ABC transporter ATP-binding protein [Pararhizobium mangrovi]TPW30620.1 ABC transporter ATP-binding protein [Pararhizobium mangrovi]
MLEVADLNSFYGGAHILHGVSLDVGQGEVVALLGRNGAGKSTTMKSIMGLVRPRSGTVTFEGQAIAGRPAYRIARLGLGYVPEDRRIFTDLTVLENLEVGCRAARGTQRAWTSERLFELFPNLAERRSARAGAMSGGEQQMLTIARTLMGNPKLVLLDEPSEGISPLIVEQMAFAIRQLKAEGIAILLSEQNLHFAMLIADRVQVIEGGRIQFHGTAEELSNQPKLREELLAL